MVNEFRKEYNIGIINAADGRMDLCYKLVGIPMSENDCFIRSINGYVNKQNQALFDCTLVSESDDTLLVRLNGDKLEVKFIDCDEEFMEEVIEKFDIHIEDELCYWQPDTIFSLADAGVNVVKDYNEEEEDEEFIQLLDELNELDDLLD